MKIAAVFASFNRLEAVLECVGRLRSQTRGLEWVVVGENGSTDGTPEALERLGWDRLVVVNTGGNLGNAGAVELAMEKAFDLGADAVWILDDDSWPRLNALEEMLRDGFDAEVVVAPVQIDPGTGRFTWPLPVVGEDGKLRLARGPGELPVSGRVQVSGKWTGALVSREIWEAVGPVNGALFIRGEDEEYPWRVTRAGFRHEVAPAAVLDHPGPSDLVEYSFCGKRLFLEPGLADWKLYYKVRNMVWLKRRQQGNVWALLMALAYILGVARVDGAQRWPLCVRAARDGWKGELGVMSYEL